MIGIRYNSKAIRVLSSSNCKLYALQNQSWLQQAISDDFLKEVQPSLKFFQ